MPIKIVELEIYIDNVCVKIKFYVHLIRRKLFKIAQEIVVTQFNKNLLLFFLFVVQTM